jgi:hypothetical protein
MVTSTGKHDSPGVLRLTTNRQFSKAYRALCATSWHTHFCEASGPEWQTNTSLSCTYCETWRDVGASLANRHEYSSSCTCHRLDRRAALHACAADSSRHEWRVQYYKARKRSAQKGAWKEWRVHRHRTPVRALMRQIQCAVARCPAGYAGSRTRIAALAPRSL